MGLLSELDFCLVYELLVVYSEGSIFDFDDTLNDEDNLVQVGIGDTITDFFVVTVVVSGFCFAIGFRDLSMVICLFVQPSAH